MAFVVFDSCRCVEGNVFLQGTEVYVIEILERNLR